LSEVECYNRSTDEWTQCPPLSCSKGSLAGVALGGKIFAIGGGDGQNCFSCMEMLDPSVGKWVFSESMNEKVPYKLIFKDKK
jgi:Kelch motif